jgi:alpha-amylase
MNQKAIILYLHVHQPYRLRPYSIFDIGNRSDYFDTGGTGEYDNARIMDKVSHKSYLPTNKKLLELLEEHPGFKLNLSFSGVVLDQMQQFAPETLKSFQELVKTGRVEIAGETYHHSLAFFYSKNEFAQQVEQHKAKIKELFDFTPTVLRNTELAYNNELAAWAEEAGYKGILAEGWDPILGWRSPNFMYQPVNTQNIRLLLKNYRLSDDIAFRFGDSNWSEWPLTADKFAHWLNADHDAQIFNLFMDYETFGEHQWEDKGIFEFLGHVPAKWLDGGHNRFMTFSEAIETYEPVDRVDMPYTVTWADTERDLTAWLGNPMQHQAVNALYGLEEAILGSGDDQLISDWRRLQTSDHFYYICTKWFADGDVHAYFSPYESPYEAFINFMNAYHDIKLRVSQKGGN